MVDPFVAMHGVDEARRLLVVARRDLKAKRPPDSWVPLLHAAIRALEVASPNREEWWRSRRRIV